MSDTPKSDAALATFSVPAFSQPFVDFTRQLERELAQANEKLKLYEMSAQGPIHVKDCHIPMMDALKTPCPHCGKKPIDGLVLS